MRWVLYYAYGIVILGLLLLCLSLYRCFTKVKNVYIKPRTLNIGLRRPTHAADTNKPFVESYLGMAIRKTTLSISRSIPTSATDSEYSDYDDDEDDDRKPKLIDKVLSGKCMISI